MTANREQVGAATFRILDDLCPLHTPGLAEQNAAFRLILALTVIPDAALEAAATTGPLDRQLAPGLFEVAAAARFLAGILLAAIGDLALDELGTSHVIRRAADALAVTMSSEAPPE